MLCVKISIESTSRRISSKYASISATSSADGSTCVAFAAILIGTPELGAINPLAVLLTPFGLMEVAAYSIAMSRSFLFMKNIIQRKPAFTEKITILVEIGIVLGLLVIGGIVEMYMIEAAEKFQSIA
jgi:hypothetical protein